MLRFSYKKIQDDWFNFYAKLALLHSNSKVVKMKKRFIIINLCCSNEKEIHNTFNTCVGPVYKD